MFFSFLESQVSEYQELLLKNYKVNKRIPGGGEEVQDVSELLRGRINCLKDIMNTEMELKQHVEAERVIKNKIQELKGAK